MRASYIASRRLLSPFLVLHRFEGNQTPDKLKRASYGYGIALNRSYLDEIAGHIRGATCKVEWGPLADGTAVDPDGTPKSGMARDIHSDATGKGVPLRAFFEGDVMEWMLSSPGGFIVVDTPPRPANVVTGADEKAAGLRPYMKFVPWSAVEDLDTSNLSWIKFCEKVDNRTPDGDSTKEDEHHILYKLLEDGTTEVARYNKDGASVNAKGVPMEPANLGKIVDPKGNPILPVRQVKYGTHPELPYLGTGLLYGLADIVIDLFNVLSEMREAFRDAAFSMFTHKGPNGEQVREQMQQGTRLAILGEDNNAELSRVSGDGGEVATGTTLIDLGVKAWALSAKRQAAETMGENAARNSSGVALSAEFQLDLRPLLVSISTAMDALETEVLFIVAQMAGKASDVKAADKLRCTRGTEFRLEDEASRIARIVKDFALSLPLSPTMKVELAMKWLEESKLLDLTKKVQVAKKVPPPAPAVDPSAKPKLGPDGNPLQTTDPAVVGNIKPAEPEMETVVLGEQIRKELEEATDAEQAGAVAAAAAGPALPLFG